MATRQMHPAQDAKEIKVHTRVRIFEILMSVQNLEAEKAKEAARGIADFFTDDYEIDE